ncbi:bifunctional cobalt-precorrin-7 (C(5))-methyltransferase/cobalt-precorrin-6B (C(15))-methyltransferase [Bacillus solimangrovi]|uniref:Cobalamin biosynthesis protein CbiE n=1 Tax=Bacillus solimangrovi TaxID=1305675 RepID=A0A1E5LGB8_9BACI|nr:bifunctional cobalt-precorrin-7 (C(5))-methyltransferase/cobalt-precorrin-6B (C(15))-methyltransferase [Bacillus solimangrovi]OEH93121.1 cobalamin biosynthesis protein CbiE [Bacillus solimangrovi]
MSEKIKLIGIGDEGRRSLLPLYEKWINECEVLVGGERQLAFFPNFQGDKIPIKVGLKSLVEKLQQESRKVIILASGDPLFYGIGSYLSNKLDIEIYPYLSSIQLAFARMEERWEDAYISSLHGRSIRGFAQKIDNKDKVAILTDQTNSPNEIAKYLISYHMTEYEAFIAENVGGETERCRWMSLSEMSEANFAPLNIVILKKKDESPVWTLGIEDEEFAQRKPDKGLLTKKEIRILTIGALNLRQDSTVWDIGTCTGSIAIEAARIAHNGAVYAIEKNKEDYENCLINTKKFRTDITVVNAKAPEGLDQFPNPDAVFIGGTAGGMEEILNICCERLNSQGRIVLNAVTIENLSAALEAFKARGFETQITLAQISRSKPILHLTRFDALNPIYIITASRKEGE